MGLPSGFFDRPPEFRYPLPGEAPLGYLKWHDLKIDTGDCDPDNAILKYAADRLNLDVEQRYWLAFLYGTTYSGASAYFMFTQLPDFHSIDRPRLELWWKENKKFLFFQTDRRWIRSRDQWVDIVMSYKRLLGGLSQRSFYESFKSPDVYVNYEQAYRQISGVFQFGRFALFIYLDLVQILTGYPMRPAAMEIRDAESCRNGLALAIGRNDLDTFRNKSKRLSVDDLNYLQVRCNSLIKKMGEIRPTHNVWNIETTLCLYKKYYHRLRWVGSCADIQAKSIIKMESAVGNRADWSVLWSGRSQNYQRSMLSEFNYQ